MFCFKRSTHNFTARDCAYRGFTLIELLVCISIVSIVSAVILVRNNSFNGAVLLRNQSYELALAIRQAQLLAVSGGESATRQYGVYVARSKPQEYIIFRDDSNNGSNVGRYDSGDTQIGLTGRLDRRFAIRDITNNAGVSQTTDGFSFTFERPNFDGLFKADSGGYLTGPMYIDIGVVGKTGTGSGAVRRVGITNTGQVSVVVYVWLRL